MVSTRALSNLLLMMILPVPAETISEKVMARAGVILTPVALSAGEKD